MNTPMMWFLLANVGFAVLWVFYRIFLHRDTFFTGKRFMLLIGLVFTLVYPLVNSASWMPVIEPVQKLSHTINLTLPEITITSNGTRNYSTMEIMKMIYFLILAMLLIRVAFQFFRLLFFALKNDSIQVGNQKVICLPKGSAPFSFFGLIFMHPEDHSENDLKEIIHHEKTHVRQAHTLDVLLAELICTVFWINPFAWFLKYDLRENLEFLADKDVVHAGFDPKSYQYHLLRLSYQQSPIRMGNNFNVSQLQNRIKMMNKKRTSQAGWGKYLLTLPLFAALLMVSYACKNKTSTDTNAKNNSVAIAPDTIIVTDTVVAPPPPPPLKSTIKFVAPAHVAADKRTKDRGIKSTVKFTAPIITVENVLPNTDSVKPLTEAEEMPKYPGGPVAMMKFITENLHYPEIAKESRIEGRVIIRFVVTKTGQITNASVIRGIYECNNEALRVINAMPKWEPGKIKGSPVDVYITLPITFKLNF
jgi:TonB family protein